MRKTLPSLMRNERGAVAPIVALSMFGLIACGGIAFDYARLATMDTELQQAADQAALAAAGQLDRILPDTSSGELGSQARARAAINGTAANRLASNSTRFANDGLGASVEFTAANITFCSAFDDSKPDATACTAATDSSDSRFVIVTTTARTANYAFTPIVAAFSGTSSATAVAGVDSAICNVAPLFVCTEDADFPGTADIGRGLVLKTGSGNSWAPGNYGLLDFGAGNGGAINALLGHGLNGCQSTSEVKTETGNKNVTDAINTRLDVYAGSPLTKDPSVCDVSTGGGCPAKNNAKDMARSEVYVIDTAPGAVEPIAPSCGEAMTDFTGERTVGEFELSSAMKGYQRDNCHYTGTCADGNFGDKVWDFAGYMADNHPGVATSAVGGTTRYAVYQWELETDRLGSRQVTASVTSADVKVKGKDFKRWTFTKQCAFRDPIFASADYPEQKDRRVLPVVAANCSVLNGKGAIGEKFKLLRVFDVFLTEPSEERSSPGVTDNKEIYGEVMGPANSFESGSGLQYYARNKPYLVR